jgi:predicted TIM-barrel fold metal-dependent hydrolase
MIMRRTQILISIFALLCPVSTQRADDIPKRFNFDRYSAMLNRSPFAVATAVALPVAAADFAKELYVANAARSAEGDMVTIASTTDTNFKEYLTTKGPVDGYSIASIEWSDRVGATKVTISKDGKFATIGFNEALLAEQPVPNVPPAIPPLRVKPAPFPTLPTPPPHKRGVIQRNAPATPIPNVPPPESPDM